MNKIEILEDKAWISTMWKDFGELLMDSMVTQLQLFEHGQYRFLVCLFSDHLAVYRQRRP
jgi:hypothetical protein